MLGDYNYDLYSATATMALLSLFSVFLVVCWSGQHVDGQEGWCLCDGMYMCKNRMFVYEPKCVNFGHKDNLNPCIYRDGIVKGYGVPHNCSGVCKV